MFDVDRDVLNAVSAVNSDIKVQTYDVAEEFPDNLLNSFHIAIIDPPWYPAALRTFLNRSIAALIPNGEIFCTLPGRLTRPGVEKFRSELIKDLVQADHEVLSTRVDCVQYQVPRFELAALKHIDGFNNIPWRSADLIHIKIGCNTLIYSEKFNSITSRVFTRNPTEFRVFVGEIERAEGVTVKDLPSYTAKRIF